MVQCWHSGLSSGLLIRSSGLQTPVLPTFHEAATIGPCNYGPLLGHGLPSSYCWDYGQPSCHNWPINYKATATTGTMKLPQLGHVFPSSRCWPCTMKLLLLGHVLPLLIPCTVKLPQLGHQPPSCHCWAIYHKGVAVGPCNSKLKTVEPTYSQAITIGALPTKLPMLGDYPLSYQCWAMYSTIKLPLLGH